jgi:hypothetical protein
MQGFSVFTPNRLQISQVWFSGKKKHFPRITLEDRAWLRKAIRQ